MSTLTELYEPIAIHLGRVETAFKNALGSDVPVVDDLQPSDGAVRLEEAYEDMGCGRVETVVDEVGDRSLEGVVPTDRFRDGRIRRRLPHSGDTRRHVHHMSSNEFG